MKYRKFGRLNEKVSQLGFGAAALSGDGGGYGFGSISDDESIQLVHAALGAGINLYDTAPIYGFGESERRLGLALRGRRDEAFLVSKCGVAYDQNKRVGLDNSPKTTQRMLEESLRRLGTEMIDLYMVHWPDPNVDIRKTVEVLQRARERGQIRYIGLSNTFHEDLEKAREITQVDAIQLEASFLNPKALDTIESTEDLSQIGVMSWGTLAKGILTGRVSRERTFESVDCRHSAPWWVNADHEPNFKVMAALQPLLKDYGTDGLALALAYLVHRDKVDTLLCGVKNLDQLETAVSAIDDLPTKAFIDQAIEIRDGVLEGAE